jgi:hypothetical protein
MRHYANRLEWSLAVTVLRTGLTTTTGHPFQGYGGILGENIGVSRFRYPAGYHDFGITGGRNCTAQIAERR